MARKPKAPDCISITIQELARASQFLVVLGNIKKLGVHALAISQYRLANIVTNVDPFLEAENGVFTNAGIKADDKGKIEIKKTHKDYEAVCAELDVLRAQRVEIPMFPVSFEELIKGMEEFEDNPISENILVELNVLVAGSVDEVVH